MMCKYQVWVTTKGMDMGFKTWVSSPAQMLAEARRRLEDPNIQMEDLRFEHLREDCCNNPYNF